MTVERLVTVAAASGLPLYPWPCCADCAFRAAERRGDQTLTLDNGVCQRTWRVAGAPGQWMARV